MTSPQKSDNEDALPSVATTKKRWSNAQKHAAAQQPKPALKVSLKKIKAARKLAKKAKKKFVSATPKKVFRKKMSHRTKGRK